VTRSAASSRSQLALGFSAPETQVRGSRPKGQKHHITGLFAGIGGLERGLHRAGHETVLLCENDPGAVSVLSAQFPGITLHEDIRTLAALPDATTLIAAGFPCQDLSQAGRTAGISGERSGLVGEVFRLIEDHRTPWVLLENVPFMLQLGGGRAMDVIASAFERLGYRWAYRVIDSRAFGLPQRRRRVYFLASLWGDPRTVLFADEADAPDDDADRGSCVACGFYWTEGVRGLGWAVDAVPTLKGGSTVGIPSAPAILLPSGEVVMPDLRDAERLQGFPADWTKPAERVTKRGARWKLVGNAVTVPAAAWLGRRLMKPGRPLALQTVPMLRGRMWPTAAWNVDGERLRVAISEWPVRRKYQPLENFLRFEPAPLSAKATAGFLGRAARSSLRFPPHLIPAVRAHLGRVSSANELERRRDGSLSESRVSTP
jgi:DNA (cytosine-5)-methyltransferase 1